MLKILGLILLVLAFTMLGFFFSFSLSNRLARLTKICRFIEETELQIRSGAELFSVFSTLGEDIGITLCGFGVEISPEHLSKKDIKLLEEFFSSLGMGDTNSQIKRCKTYALIFKKQEQQAAEQVSLKAGLYRKLGFFAGLFLAIMLI